MLRVMSGPTSTNVDAPRVFLSYGHDRYLSVAVRLKQDLEEQGFPVWFDRERLLAGIDWDRAIEDGLDWAAQQVRSMTPTIRLVIGSRMGDPAQASWPRVPR